MTEQSFPNAKEICEECLKKTKIGYKYKGHFFSPRLRGINALQIGRSSIISNPITIIIEYLYRLYARLKKFITNLSLRLFPRRPKLYGTVMDSALVGKIVFAQKGHQSTPIHHLPLEFWSRGWMGKWRKLSQGYSNEDGTFSLPFDLRESRRFRNRTLCFEINNITHISFNEVTSRPVYNVFKSIPIPKSDLIGMDYNLRTIQLFYWEYRDDTQLPRVVVNQDGKDVPQKYSDSRENALIEQFLPIELTKVKHLIQIQNAPETITLQQIQADYPENLTACIEKRLPGYTRTDAWFGERLMNGMNRACFMRSDEHVNTYKDSDLISDEIFWVKYFGKGFYEGNDDYAFPDVAIKCKLKPDGLPTPLEIHLTGPLNKFNKDPWQHRVFTPLDGDQWLQAKRIARVNGGLCTEVAEHFAGTHLNTEQYAAAAYRNLRFNPLATLLYPHLKDVILINHSADKILLEEYIPSASALTHQGLLHRCYDLMGVLDWKGYVTNEPLSDAHHSARAEKLFWELTEEYVTWFIHSNLESIKKYWFEIYCFSEDLLNHSVPVIYSQLDMEAFDERQKNRIEKIKTYLSHQFSFNLDQPRETRAGVLRAVSPITKVKVFPEAQQKETLADLIQACTYIIFTATYLHTWANEHQYEDIGEVLYNSLGLRFGEKETGVLAPESDLGISPDLTRSTQMMWFSNFLSRTEYGFITRNEDKDVNPYFSNLLLAKKEEFKALGVDITAIESSTNI